VPYDQNAYVQPVYEPGLNVIVIGGQRGYYDSYHVFQPMIVMNGYSGYRNSRGQFVSSAPEVRSYQQSGKPMYTGPSSTSRGPQTLPQGNTYNQSKPNYGSGGSMSRGPSDQSQRSFGASAKPNYGGGGSMSRGSAVATPARQSSPTRSSSSTSRGTSSRR